jgi:hypothetical protein
MRNLTSALLFCSILIFNGCDGPVECDEYYTLTLYSCTNARIDFFNNFIVCVGGNREQIIDSRISPPQTLNLQGCTIRTNGEYLHEFDNGIETKYCK